MIDLAQLRADYQAVRAWFVAIGEWTEADAVEIGYHLRDLIAAQDTPTLTWWAQWMRHWADLRTQTDIVADSPAQQQQPTAGWQ